MWVLDSTRIYVTGLQGNDKNIIARLQPLNGGTIHQTFGYENEIKKVSAIVIGEDDLEALKALAESETTYTFSGYGIDYGDYYVANVSWNRANILYQTIKLPCTEPMFNVEIELYQ